DTSQAVGSPLSKWRGVAPRTWDCTTVPRPGETTPVLTIPLATWIANAAAVLTGPWGDVTRRARQVPCSRPTVYDPPPQAHHARKVEPAVAAEQQGGPPRGQLLDRLRALQAENARLWDWLGQTIDFPAPRRDQFVVTAAAMGLSLSQVGALLAIVVGVAACPS